MLPAADAAWEKINVNTVIRECPEVLVNNTRAFIRPIIKRAVAAAEDAIERAGQLLCTGPLTACTSSIVVCHIALCCVVCIVLAGGGGGVGAQPAPQLPRLRTSSRPAQEQPRARPARAAKDGAAALLVQLRDDNSAAQRSHLPASTLEQPKPMSDVQKAAAAASSVSSLIEGLAVCRLGEPCMCTTAFSA